VLRITYLKVTSARAKSSSDFAHPPGCLGALILDWRPVQYMCCRAELEVAVFQTSMFLLLSVPDESAVAQRFAMLLARRLSQRWLLILCVLASDGAASSGCRLGVGVPNRYVGGLDSQLGSTACM
jgi:hypothetical protein